VTFDEWLATVKQLQKQPPTQAQPSTPKHLKPYDNTQAEYSATKICKEISTLCNYFMMIFHIHSVSTDLDRQLSCETSFERNQENERHGNQRSHSESKFQSIQLLSSLVYSQAYMIKY